jgi:hypothetical protein
VHLSLMASWQRGFLQPASTFFFLERQFKNVQFCSRSRKAKILTTGIH